MGLCWTGPCQDCQNNCKSWFAGDNALIDGCKTKCKSTKGKSPTSRDDYLNIIGAGSEVQAAEQAQAQASNEQQKELLKQGGKIVVFIVLVILVIWLIKRFSK